MGTEKCKERNGGKDANKSLANPTRRIITPAEPKRPKLLDQMRDLLRVKHDSKRTEEVYLDWVKRVIYFHQKRHPKEIGAVLSLPRMRESTLHLSREQDFSISFSPIPGWRLFGESEFLLDFLVFGLEVQCLLVGFDGAGNIFGTETDIAQQNIGSE